MENKETYRRACRRSHRLLGTYLALVAWVRKVDCVVLARSQLLPFLGLERMKDKRVDWLKADVLTLFPHASSLVMEKSGIYASLYLSRVPFPAGCFEVFMLDAERIKKLAKSGIAAAIVDLPTEGEMIALLAKTVHGMKTFTGGVRELTHA